MMNEDEKSITNFKMKIQIKMNSRRISENKRFYFFLFINT